MASLDILLMDIPDHLLTHTVKLYWCVGFVAVVVN